MSAKNQKSSEAPVIGSKTEGTGLNPILQCAWTARTLEGKEVAPPPKGHYAVGGKYGPQFG